MNAMAVGIVKHNETATAKASGVGNPVFIVGSSTGKDGIHGATFASADITEDSAEKLPSVQVGDPFQEKLLLEASLEIIETGAFQYGRLAAALRWPRGAFRHRLAHWQLPKPESPGHS